TTTVGGGGFIRVVEGKDRRASVRQVFQRGKELLRLPPFLFGYSFRRSPKAVNDNDVIVADGKVRPGSLVAQRRGIVAGQDEERLGGCGPQMPQTAPHDVGHIVAINEQHTCLLEALTTENASL